MMGNVEPTGNELWLDLSDKQVAIMKILGYKPEDNVAEIHLLRESIRVVIETPKNFLITEERVTRISEPTANV